MHPLAVAAPLIRDCLAAIADDSGHLVVVSDADGTLLWIDGNARVRLDAAASMNFAEGSSGARAAPARMRSGRRWPPTTPCRSSPASTSTRSCSDWTCSAAPGPRSRCDGRLLGVIDLTGLAKTAHPHSLAVAVTTARAVESHLRLLLRERDALLRARHEQRVAAAGDRSRARDPERAGAGSSPARWLPAERLALPAAGGELVLPSGVQAVAEPVGDDEAFVVRGLDDGAMRHRVELRREAIEAADAERARLARDLHDGAQQRLVHAVVTLKLSRRALQEGGEGAEALVSEALEQAEQAHAELRELAHGSLPGGPETGRAGRRG